MNKILSLLGSFRTKVTVAFVVLVIIVISLNNLIIYKLSVDAQINQLRENLMVVAQTAALMIDGDMISQIPLDHSGIEDNIEKSAQDKGGQSVVKIYIHDEKIRGQMDMAVHRRSRPGSIWIEF
ncbi:MAG: hypothetical protein NTZ95_00890 [Candidatus Omnitrophica bacterium]|nr:hypothetical protein [Candidatus Omnitrophota bacterium]